jgi:hypothetical protein
MIESNEARVVNIDSFLLPFEKKGQGQRDKQKHAITVITCHIASRWSSCRSKREGWPGNQVVGSRGRWVDPNIA